jgi:Flp pilus assembly protein TadB
MKKGSKDKKRNNSRRSPRRRFNSRSRHTNRRINKRRRRASPLKKINFFTGRHPIISGIVLIIASFISLRLSFTEVFWFGPETFLWLVLFSIILFLIGLFILVAWWRNNVSMFTTKHNVGWKSR